MSKIQRSLWTQYRRRDQVVSAYYLAKELVLFCKMKMHELDELTSEVRSAIDELQSEMGSSRLHIILSQMNADTGKQGDAWNRAVYRLRHQFGSGRDEIGPMSPLEFRHDRKLWHRKYEKIHQREWKVSSHQEESDELVRWCTTMGANAFSEIVSFPTAATQKLRVLPYRNGDVIDKVVIERDREQKSRYDSNLLDLDDIGIEDEVLHELAFVNERQKDDWINNAMSIGSNTQPPRNLRTSRRRQASQSIAPLLPSEPAQKEYEAGTNTPQTTHPSTPETESSKQQQGTSYPISVASSIVAPPMPVSLISSRESLQVPNEDAPAAKSADGIEAPTLDSAGVRTASKPRRRKSGRSHSVMGYAKPRRSLRPSVMNALTASTIARRQSTIHNRVKSSPSPPNDPQHKRGNSQKLSRANSRRSSVASVSVAKRLRPRKPQVHDLSKIAVMALKQKRGNRSRWKKQQTTQRKLSLQESSSDSQSDSCSRQDMSRKLAFRDPETESPFRDPESTSEKQQCHNPGWKRAQILMLRSPQFAHDENNHTEAGATSSVQDETPSASTELKFGLENITSYSAWMTISAAEVKLAPNSVWEF